MTDMYLTTDGSPRYGIRTSPTEQPAHPPAATFGTAAAQAQAMDLVDLDIAAQFLPVLDMRDRADAMERTFPQEVRRARQHLKASLGSPPAWIEAARSRGDGDTTMALPGGRAALLGVVLCLLLVSSFVPAAVGFAVFLREGSLWAALGAGSIAFVVLAPAKALGRKFAERCGYKVREHAAAEADVMWDMLVCATAAEAVADQGRLPTNDEHLQMLSGPWAHLLQVVEKTREIKAL